MIITPRKNCVRSAWLLNGAALPTLAVSLAIGLAGAAGAQETRASLSQNVEPEIVVTGTLIRGVAPTGSDVVSVSSEQVQATGASTTAQLLQTIPQLGSFNNLVFPQGGSNTVTTNRPNLRNLPGFNTAGGSTTLVMLDGHRLVGMGISSTTPDPDIIPPGAIQRLEIVPDGGSAIYGSDAVAGVMNFITRRDLNGLELNGRTGFADDYYTFDINGTLGKTWTGGSAFISYAYSEHDAIFGRDRDYIRTFPTRSSVVNGPSSFTSLTCAPGNVIVGANTPGSTIYALPYSTGTAASARGRANQCDASDDASFYPKEHHHSVMAGLSQELSPSLSVDLRGYYFNRETETYGGAFTKTTSATPATAGFASHVVGAETSQTVQFGWGGSTAIRQPISVDSWGLSGTFTAKPFGDWQVRLLGNYGQSSTTSRAYTYNDNALNAAISNGLFNPYDPLASDPAAYSAVNNWETFGRTRQRLLNARAIADGTLFQLPGGDVKMAVGVEYIREEYRSKKGTTIPGTEETGFGTVGVRGVTLIPGQGPVPNFRVARNVKAAFGELSVPIVGQDIAMPGLRELTLSLSGRYDDYSDVGDTFNPKIGVNYRPVEWVRLRGSWGRSFNAPSLADAAGAELTGASFVGPLGFLPAIVSFYQPPAALVANGTYPATNPLQTILSISGNSPGITPQKAKTLSFGGDIDPPFIPGLRLGMTYWRIDFTGRIGLAPFFDRNLYWGSYGRLITVNPTSAQIAAALAGAQTTSGTQCFTGAPAQCVYAILDTRKTNLGDVKVSGLDFNLSYQRETGFGSVDFVFNGSKELTRDYSSAAGQPFVDQLVANNSTFRFTSTLGANVGNLRGQVTWNHTQGYDLLPVQGLIAQNRVGAFNVFNLFFRYDVKGEGAFKDLAFTLNVDNVFDQDPPVDWSPKSSVSQAGYGNGNTLGRLFQLGVSKRF